MGASLCDDLVLMAKSEAELKQKLLRWRNRIVAKGLKVNVVMTGGEGLCTIKEFGSYPCRVHGKSVGKYSIRCTSCSKWLHCCERQSDSGSPRASLGFFPG